MSTRSGYVSIIGKPNVGKSTLLNELLEKKISITADKSQTTRNNIMGIKTHGETQIIFLDTPGIHSKKTKILNKVLNKSAQGVIEDSDLILFLVQRNQLDELDQKVLDIMKGTNQQVICVVNKIDQLADKQKLLPFMEKLSSQYDFKAIVPISALKKSGIDDLLNTIIDLLPENPHLFPEDYGSNLAENSFYISEIVREKLTRTLGDEIPYELYVNVETNEVKGKVRNIGVIIHVAKQSQKNIVIGNNGDILKKIGKAARLDLEETLGEKVMLKSWVKVKKNWSKSLEHIQGLGIGGNKDA